MTTCPGLGKVTPSPGLMVSMSTPISLVVRVFRVRSNGAWMSDEKYLLRHVRSLSLDESSCIQANSLPKTVFQSSNLTAQLKGQGWSGELTNKFPSQSSQGAGRTFVGGAHSFIVTSGRGLACVESAGKRIDTRRVHDVDTHHRSRAGSTHRIGHPHTFAPAPGQPSDGCSVKFRVLTFAINRRARRG